MGLKTTIEEKLKAAMKQGDGAVTSLMRMLLSQFHNREIEKRAKSGASALSEEEMLDVLGKELKKRKESIELFKRGNREDLARKEEWEASIIGDFLPPPIKEEEIETLVKKIITQGASDFPSVMREAMKDMKGRVDGTLVSTIIKKQLGK